MMRPLVAALAAAVSCGAANAFTVDADTYADLYVNGVLQEHKQLNPLVWPPKTGGPLVGAGENYEGMASVDLAGKKRLNGKYIDIGCYESQSTPMTILVR